MTTKIEFHMIQSFPPSNLNRDDTNMPKDCEFGGARRARISSQCIKRSIRLHPDFQKYTGVEPGDRTRRLIAPVMEKLIAGGMANDEALKKASGFVEALLGGLDKKKESEQYPRSKVLFYISNEEIEMITKSILDCEQSGKEYKDMLKEYVKQFSTRTSAPDIALFGRMLADNPALSLEASCQVAHAISTHRVNMEMDFYTAVDDLQKQEDAGAGMMGTTGFNSATFYRYAAVDWKQLLVNLGNEVVLAQNTVKGFLSAMAKATPTGKQNAFAAQTPPALILVVVRTDGQAWSLANAFEKPVTAKGEQSVAEASIAALDAHWQQLNRMYGDAEQPSKVFALTLDDLPGLHALKDTVVDSLSSLLKKVEEALPQE